MLSSAFTSSRGQHTQAWTCAPQRNGSAGGRGYFGGWASTSDSAFAGAYSKCTALAATCEHSLVAAGVNITTTSLLRDCIRVRSGVPTCPASRLGLCSLGRHLASPHLASPSRSPTAYEHVFGLGAQR